MIFYAQTRLHTEAFTQRSLYTEELLHTKAFTHSKLLHTQGLLHREVCTQRSFLHTGAFWKQISAFWRPLGRLLTFSSGIIGKRPFLAKSWPGAFWKQKFRPFGGPSAGYWISLLGSLGNGRFWPNLGGEVLHREVFTLRSFCTQTSRSLYTQKLLHEEVVTQIYSFLSLTDAFTHRSFYTEKPLHREFYTRKLLHTVKSLHRRAFTHRSFHTQKLLHKEVFIHKVVFTHRNFYT